MIETKYIPQKVYYTAHDRDFDALSEAERYCALHSLLKSKTTADLELCIKEVTGLHDIRDYRYDRATLMSCLHNWLEDTYNNTAYKDLRDIYVTA